MFLYNICAVVCVHVSCFIDAQLFFWCGGLPHSSQHSMLAPDEWPTTSVAPTGDKFPHVTNPKRNWTMHGPSCKRILFIRFAIYTVTSAMTSSEAEEAPIASPQFDAALSNLYISMTILRHTRIVLVVHIPSMLKIKKHHNDDWQTDVHTCSCVEV